MMHEKEFFGKKPLKSVWMYCLCVCVGINCELSLIQIIKNFLSLEAILINKGRNVTIMLITIIVLSSFLDALRIRATYPS